MNWLFVISALIVSTPLAARDLAVPADKGWKHAETGVILKSQLAGMPRTALTDATQSEHDVAAQFEAADKSVFATVYIFHPAIADVGMWFDRSQMALETRDLFHNAAPASADPVSFAAAGTGSASSLRQAYAIPGGRYRSTALAVMPVGDWIVSLRMSSGSLTADQLDLRLQDVVKSIGWPAAAATSTSVATPLKPCAVPLAFPKKAKLTKPDGADLLMTLLGGTMAVKEAAKKKDAPPPPKVTWCREGKGLTDYGVYRADNEATGYIIALYDAGRVASVQPSIMGQVEKKDAYAVSLTDVDGTISTFPSFSAMPKPEQVWGLVSSGNPTGKAKGDQVTIDPKAL